MNGSALDKELADGLELMAESRWVEAQQILADRLRNNPEADQKRLNYFLLSITSASSGRGDLGDRLWAKAQSCALGSLTARYLDLQLAPNDPRQSVLIDLERAWWNFNQWNSVAPSSSPSSDSLSIEWESVLSDAQAGLSADIESKYGRCFDDQTCQTAILWNLLALAYLEAGNVRTYNEMLSNRPSPPKSIPPTLKSLLEEKGLTLVQEALEQGQWIQTGDLTPPSESFDTSQPQGLSEQQWAEQMENGFALLDLNQYLEAGRAFQSTSQIQDRDRQLLGLNALALSFFKLGDYTQSETVYQEFKMLLDQQPIDESTDLVQRYKRWLESVDSLPEDGQSFFKPFGTKADWSSGQQADSEVDLWKSLSECLKLCIQNQHSEAKRDLQILEKQLGETAGYEEKYLVALCFLVSAVLAGDHFEVQEFEMELSSLRSQLQFSSEQLQEAADIFQWSGLEKLAAHFSTAAEGRPQPLNPWQDVVIEQSEEQAFQGSNNDDLW